VSTGGTINAIAVAPGYAQSGLASATYTVVGFSDSLTGPSINPFWTVIQQFGTIKLTSAGAQFSSLSGGQRELHLRHVLGSASKGSVGFWFWDAAPGQETLYEGLVLSNSSQPQLQASIGTMDFDAYCYEAQFSDQAGQNYGQNARCGIYPQVSTTSVTRTLGWHYLNVIFWPGSVAFYIDGQQVFSVAGDYSFDTIDLKMSGPYWRPDTVAYFGSFNYAP
jgi:hypothetical protein